MQSAEVVIVGGGPAGAACAWSLRRAGVDVAVLDQAGFPRDKICAGWITPAVLDELEIDLADYARERVLQPITGFRIGRMGQAMVDIHYPRTISYGIRRYEFDDYLLRRAQVRLLTGQPVRAVRRDGDGWVVDETLRAAMLVGAGGHLCPVARALGARPGGEPAVVAQEIEFQPPADALAACAVRAEQPELYFCRDLAGYGWCFRKGDFLNVGLGRDDPRNLSRHVADFLAFLERERGVPPPPGRFRGHAYLLHGHGRRELLDDAVLLVGDAAGLAYPRSGEGIRPAVESGLLAARTLLEAAGDYRRGRLEPYRSRLASRFGRGPSLSGAIPAGIRDLLAQGLFSHPGLVREVILEHGFLHRRQAALSPLRGAAGG